MTSNWRVDWPPLQRARDQVHHLVLTCSNSIIYAQPNSKQQLRTLFFQPTASLKLSSFNLERERERGFKTQVSLQVNVVGFTLWDIYMCLCESAFHLLCFRNFGGTKISPLPQVRIFSYPINLSLLVVLQLYLFSVSYV